MYVIKADGKKEAFRKEKIIKTCMRSDTSRKVAGEIADIIESSIANNTSTHKIYKLILEELEKRTEKSSFFFMLRHAVSNMDSYTFELYAKNILEFLNFRCQWNKLIKGRYVEHQVDVIAHRDHMYLVECKHHFNPHRYTGLDVCLQVQARLEDIQEGFNHGNNNYCFDRAWIFTNTKFSDHAKAYSEGRQIRLTGWKYKGSDSLEKIVQQNRIFPVTVLKTDIYTHKKLMQQRIITVHDLIAKKSKISGISSQELAELIKQAKNLLL